MMYYTLPDGEPTSRLQTLLPDVISPQFLTDAELAERGIARCEVVHPIIEWHQQRGERTFDTTQTPHILSLAVEDRPLDDVKARAVARLNEERDRRFESGFSFAGTAFDSRQQDRENIAGAVQLATLWLMSGGDPLDTKWHGGEQDFVWINANNDLTVLSAGAMIEFGKTAAAHKHLLIFTARAYKDAALAGTTVAEVVAVEWPE